MFIPEVSFNLLVENFLDPKNIKKFLDQILGSGDQVQRAFICNMVSFLLKIVISYNQLTLDEDN